ncbi:MAG: protein ndvB, partial [Candidatus Saccharibacteria bacterium]|nr:protein ndvB [Pseudorhodobacter sp.]
MDMTPLTENVAAQDPRLPIRQDFWHGGTVRDVGARIASETAATPIAFVPFRLGARIDGNRAAVRRIYLRLLAETNPRGMVTPAAEWLLDNHHVVDENFRHLRRDMADRVYRKLPAIPVSAQVPGKILGPAASKVTIPRTLSLVWTFVAVTNSDLTLEGLTDCVDGFQSVRDLTIGEVWAIPALLRFVLLENLRRLADRIETSRAARARANAFADAILQDSPDAATLARLAGERADESFAAQLLYRLRESDGPQGDVLRWLEQGLSEAGLTAEQVISKEQTMQSTGNVTVGNIIRALRKIDDVDWLEWFERVNRVDAILRRDQDYSSLDKSTRNQYRSQVERIARRSDSTEQDVALLVVTPRPETEPPLALLGSGQAALEAACGYRPTLNERIMRSYRRLGWLGISAPFVAITLAVLWSMYVLVAPAESQPLLMLMLLALLPASDVGMSLVHVLAARFLPTDRLPGYDYRTGIPDDMRTLVVIPCLLTSRDEIDVLVRNLELHYLSNSTGAVSFALLSDWVDCAKEHKADDDAMLDHARDEIEALQARYLHDGGRRFFLLHRRRIYNPSEGVWMGWERKRGKLVELNNLLRNDEDTSYMDTGARPEGFFRYVVTLDADTRLTRGVVPELVGKIAHPVNRAVLNAHGRVVRGYGILQPRVTPSLTTGADASIFQRSFSSSLGLDPYVFTVSDLYQDHAGEGSFTGKGIYDIDAFRSATDGAIDENAVLSHDMLEGSLARAALVTDVQFVEDFPVQYHVDTARQHRWARGDWQLLPYIFGRGTGLNGIARLKMIDNLRRSLVPIFWVLASIVGWLGLSVWHSLLWQAALVSTLIAGPMLAFGGGLRPRDPSVRLVSHLLVLTREARNLAVLTLFRIAFLADHAWVMADAILRTVYRVTISHKLLLEWRTAGQVAAGGNASVLAYFRRMWGSVAVGACTILVTSGMNPDALTACLPIAGLWIVAPLVAWAISQTEESVDHLEVSRPDAAILRRSARLTWRFFEEFVTEASHHLPPDNFQDLPLRMIAERTSPTNIGLYLLSVVSARDFGWISLRAASDRIDATLTTLEALPKFRGHLYNWYSTADLSLLQPHYVSTVDSGNLAGHLVTVTAALNEWASISAVHLPPDDRGIGDVLDVLRQQLAAIPNDRRQLRPLRRRVEERLIGFAESYASYMKEPQFAPVRGMSLSVIS